MKIDRINIVAKLLPKYGTPCSHTHVAIILSQIKDKDKVLKVPSPMFVRFIAAPAQIPSRLGSAKALPLF